MSGSRLFRRVGVLGWRKEVFFGGFGGKCLFCSGRCKELGEKVEETTSNKLPVSDFSGREGLF